MLGEGSGVMEKKIIGRQPAASAQCRNGTNSLERKSDFVPNKRGRGRRQSFFPTGKTSDGQGPRPNPIQKWDRPIGDRRQRQRGGYDYRQREEVVESGDIFDVLTTGSRKGNANHLLNFKFHPRQSVHDDHNRSYFKSRRFAGSGKAKRYKKEQFLQACCQFIVRDTGDYTEQAINCDTLVDWSMIELVRSFSNETVHCPICLQYPVAGKITRCGHTYCWACILHYLKLGQDEARKCPICFETVEVDELRSVQWIDVPSFNIGDEISLKLMRKAKGSVLVFPKEEWEDRKGKHMSIKDGPNTKYMKLLVASLQQIQSEVIDKERDALTAQLIDAEDSEVCFIQMALDCLAAREASLDLIFREKIGPKNTVYIPGLGSIEARKSDDVPVSSANIGSSIDCTTYTDAFEDDILEGEEETVELAVADTSLSVCDSDRQRNDSESSLPFGSPPCPYPLLPDQEVNEGLLSLEETSDNLELPTSAPPSDKRSSRLIPILNTSDNYYFYQATTGQHIYMNSLNAQCLAKEYGSLEDSPNVVKATIVAIERIFMTEDVRKRLRYLDHVPLTSEVHVVELNVKPPTVSKETLKFFEAAFNRRRKQRQQKEKEDKRRAKKLEIEHKKSFGIYPEVHLPLDNIYQFPAPLSGQGNLEDETIRNLAESATTHSGESDHHRSRNDSTTSEESLNGSKSFAQMLRGGKTSVPSGPWGRPLHSSSILTSPTPVPRQMRGGDDSDGESLPAPNYCDTMSDAIARALDSFTLQKQTGDNASPQSAPSSAGRKKRKGKQILFSTSMAREKN